MNLESRRIWTDGSRLPVHLLCHFHGLVRAVSPTLPWHVTFASCLSCEA